MFIDETGLLMQPLVRRTWAPRGQTPVMDCWSRHKRLSVIGALTLAPRRRRIGLYFSVYESNITAEVTEQFVRHLQRQVRRPLVVILDRWSVHRKAAKALEADPKNRFDIQWLPPYAPELNPVEYLWSHTKYADLANLVPEDLLELEIELEWSITQTQWQPKLLRSFFHAAKLTI